MGTTLTGTTPQTTYDSLIKVTDNAPLTGSLKTLTDGLGNDSALALSTGAASVTGTLAVSSNLTVDTNTLFVDATNNRVGVITNSPSYNLDVQTTATSTTIGDNTALFIGSQGSGRDVNIRFGDSVNASARIGYTSGALYLLTNALERMRITTAGNIGIGTSSPAAKLDARISGTSSGAVITVGNTSSGYFGGLAVSDGGAYPVQLYGAAISLLTGNVDYASATEKVRITSTGAVGIGTSSPAEKLDVVGGALAAGNGTIRTGITYSSLGLLGTFTNHDLGLLTNGAEKVRITSSGNVGIGTTSPAAKLQVNDANNIGIRIGDLTSVPVSQTAVYLATSTSTFTGGNGDLVLIPRTSDNRSIIFYTGSGTPSERVRIDSSGNVGIGTSSPSQKLEVAGVIKIGDGVLSGGGGVEISSEAFFGFAAQSNAYKFRNGANTTTYAILDSDGLKFNGDTAAANALDDYEEGTWTMGIAFGGASTGVTYVANTGTYTKIGRQVSVSGNIELSSKGSSTGSATITGLPFASSSSASFRSAASLRLSNVAFANAFQAPNNPNTTEIVLSEITEAGVDSIITNVEFANNSNIIVSMTYFV